MGLRVKRAPAQLRPADIVETVWPDDDAVDRESSDLVTWCREGGMAGLVLKPDIKPDIIRWRALDEPSFGRISELLEHGSRNIVLTSFRHGIVGIDGMKLRRCRIDDADGLHDSAMRELSAHKMDLPYLVALRAMNEAWSGEKEAEPPSESVMETTMAQVIGAHILAATFRARPNAA